MKSIKYGNLFYKLKIKIEILPQFFSEIHVSTKFDGIKLKFCSCLINVALIQKQIMKKRSYHNNFITNAKMHTI